MATAKRIARANHRHRAARPPSGGWRARLPGGISWLGGLAMVGLAAGLGWVVFGEQLTGYARAGTAYGAKLACSCRHISGRPLEGGAPGACTRDFVPGMSLVFLSEDEEARSVTARVPLLHAETATYRQGFGCVLEPWPGTGSDPAE